MEHTLRILLALALAGCGGVSVEPCPSDGGPPAADAAPEAPSGWSGRGACTLMGVAYQARQGRGLDCPQVACPVSYDTSGRTDTICDPAAVEACLWALESRANACDGYRDVMATECADIACVSVP